MARSSSSSSPLLLVGGLVAVVVVALGVALLLMGPDAEPVADDGAAGIGPAPDERSMDLPGSVAGEEAAPLRAEAPAPAASRAVLGESVALPGLDGVRRVAGRLVRAADGTPLDGVVVWVDHKPRRTDHGPGGPYGEEAPVADATGRFLLEEVPASATLVVDLNGSEHGLILVTHDLPDGDADLVDQVFEVDTGSTLRGVVRDRNGAPVVGAEVRGEGDLIVPAGTHGGGLRSTAGETTDVTGAFELRDLFMGGRVSGPLTLRAVGDLHAPASLVVELPEDPGLIDGLVLELTRAGSIAGRVVGPDGAPVPGARVDAPWSVEGGYVGDAPFEDSARTDADGRYRLRGVAAGEYIVVLQHGRSGWASEWGRAFPAGSLEARQGVVVDEGRTTTVDFIRPAAAEVSGRVTDAAGNPQRGAQVSAEWQLIVPAGERVGSWIRMLRGGVSKSRDDPTGKVSVVSVPIATNRSDDRGGFGFDGLPAGRVVLTAVPDPADAVAGLRVSPARLALDLSSGAALPGVDLVVGAGLVLEGRVTDADGRPVEDASVAVTEAGPSYLVTSDDFLAVDEGGRFAFEGLAPGRYTVHARSSGYRDWSEQVDAGGLPVDVKLLEAPTLTGQVRDGATLAPITDYTIRVETQGMHMTAEWSHEEGRFLVDSLEEGAYTVTITADGYAPSVHEGLELAFGAPLALDVLLSR